MKHKLLSTLLSAAMLATGLTANAVPARRGLNTITSADGTELKVYIHGDERSHYYTTEDGYLLAADNGSLCYAKLDAQGTVVSSGVKAVNVGERRPSDRALLNTIDAGATLKAYKTQATASGRQVRSPRANAQGPGLFPGTAFPSQGEQKVLVVLVQYTNVSFSVNNPAEFYHRQLNEQGFSDYGATGSARDFYVDGSMGQFLPDMEVFGPITLAHNQAYYGGNDWWGNDQHPEEMVIEACQQLDDTVDFSEFDRDGDGYIDNVYVIYAGKGEADGGGQNTVWPHSWEVSAATSTPYYFDGVRLDRYACSNEWDNYGNRPDGIGTFCHEFAHVMGLPDLYATSYTSAFTPGAYSVMDYGPYNNDGLTPPTFSAFERYALGWIDPVEIKGQLNGRLDHILDTNEAYIINTGDAEEYFLFENRQKKGWDTYIPGHGMLVWHVDYDASVWASNVVNNSASHQYVDLEEADGKPTSGTTDGDPFPGTSRKTEFTDDTSPSMRTWAGKRLELPITDIAEDNGVITFRVCGGFVDVDAPVIDTDNMLVEVDRFTARWSTVDDATAYHATLEKDNADGTRRVYVGDWNCKSIGKVTQYTFGDLEPETRYYLTVFAENSGSLSPASNTLVVTTLAPDFEHQRVKVKEATDITSEAFTINWELRDEAVDYLVNVYTRSVDGVETVTVDFTGGLSEMPEGWTTTSRSTYSSKEYCGQSAPSLKLNTDGDYIESPVYDNDVISVGFWMRGASADPNNYLTLSANIDGLWTVVNSYTVNNLRGGTSINVDVLPAGTHAIRLSYTKVGAGNVAIDDITLAVASEMAVNPVEGYEDCAAGNVGSLTVTGLEPSTRYYFTVAGVNAEGLRTLPSAERYAETTEPTGIEAVSAVEASLSVEGLSISVSTSANTRVSIADVAGREVARAAGSTYLRVPAPGVYMVTVGNETHKVVVR